jgi:primosomal protein N' (replication factor Y)
MNLYAEVIIPLALPKTYTYKVPEHFADIIQRGVRVEVELRKKRYAGVVKSIITQKPQAFDPKEILNILDQQPIVHDTQLQFWSWIADYYMCSEGEVMHAALPSYFKLSSQTILVYDEEYGDDFSLLDDEEYLVAEALHIRKELKLTEIQQLLDSSHVYPVIKRLIEKRVCIVWEAMQESYKPKKETYVLLNPAYHDEDKLSDLLNNWSRAPKQMELLLSYLHLIKTEGEVTKTALLKKSGASDAQLKGLVEKGVLLLEKRNVDRIKVLPSNIHIDFNLTLAQEKAFEEIHQQFSTKQVCLLHGITSSGKTQIYIKLIEEHIRKRKQVLYLLPEIALTSQIIRRLQKHFGGYIAIYHSKFNQNERIEIWNKVKNEEVKVVLGARSSLFLPFKNLSLIICDEEHDASYKQQDPAPRYNARDAAVYYASIFQAKVLLGSATPSVESYYNAVLGKYGLVELNERYGGVELPSIEIVDTKQVVTKDRSKVIVSPQLKEAIEHALEKNKQVILFQNRRGYSPYQICNVCGWIPHCKNCDVTLTYHKLSNKLQCHYCGSTYPLIHTCMACGSHDFSQKNFGTERIEEYLLEQFPLAKIARMDMDAVRGKTAHDALIQQFEQQRIDILVGTQMVVKGLDFEHVSLVGILDADGILGFTDFRVNERGFQLMEQVSGRAGRKAEQGRVIIQASNTNHAVLHFVRQHNYKSFFEAEIKSRQQFAYPPFTRLIHFQFRHKYKEVAEEAANIVTHALKPHYGKHMTGPAEPVVGRVRNQYLIDLLLKLPRDVALISGAKNFIHEQIAILHTNRRYSGVSVMIDVDPV